jgi:heme ABC exporter ATP-binding subunit CcmA
MPDFDEWFEPLGSENDALIAADGVCRAFGRVPVLFPLTFMLSSGQALALLGPNGSGKTTLLRMLAGVVRPSAGNLEVCGHVMPEDRRLVARDIAFVGHDSYLYDDLTGLENLKFSTSMRGASLPEMRLLEALDAVGMSQAATSRVRTYSAGMKRRVGLALLLLLGPRLLLLDEPHASLDVEGQSLIDAIVRKAQGSGRGVVLASHDHSRTLALCTSVLLLDGGRVTFHGESEEWRRRLPIWFAGGSTS